MPEDTVKNEVENEEVKSKPAPSSKKKKAAPKKAEAPVKEVESLSDDSPKPKATVVPRASNRRRN